MIEINTFDEMIEFIRNRNLTKKQISEIVQNCINCILIEDYETKEDIINALIKFWDKYKHLQEKPIFIDLDISVQE
jgi:Zn-finger protein